MADEKTMKKIWNKATYENRLRFLVDNELLVYATASDKKWSELSEKVKLLVRQNHKVITI